MQETTLEVIEDIGFSCVLPPNINFLSSKQNAKPKIDAQRLMAFGCYCCSLTCHVFYTNKQDDIIKYK